MMRAMDPAAIAALLEAVRDGRTDVPAALERLRELPFEAASEELVSAREGTRDGASGPSANGSAASGAPSGDPHGTGFGKCVLIRTQECKLPIAI